MVTNVNLPTDDSDSPIPSDPPGSSPIPPVPPAPTRQPRVALGADGAVPVPPTPGGFAAATPPLWKRIPRRVLIIGVIIAVVAIVAWAAGRGTTDAEDLKAGDCFEQPGLTDIRDVNDQSCDGVHESEILVVATLTALDPYPGDESNSAALSPADIACGTAIELLDINEDNIPTDTQTGYFFADRSDWDDGDRNLLCYAFSPSGFPGPVVNR